MKCYSWIFCLIGVVCVLSVTPSYCKTKTYTWAKGNIEITTNGELDNPGTNDAQNNILVKEAVRNTAYQTLGKFLSALPLDSTRNIGDLVKSNLEFAHQLNLWVTEHSTLTHFQYTSESTGSLKISVNAQQFSRFVAQYDKPVVVKAKTPPVKTAKSVATDTSPPQKTLAADTTKTEKNMTMDTSKPTKLIAVDTSKNVKVVAVDTTKPAAPVKEPSPLERGLPMGDRRRMPPTPMRIVQAEVQMNVAKDTSIPNSVRVSQAEAGIRGMEKEELYRQLNDTSVSGNITYNQWVHTHPGYEDSLKMAIDNNTMMGKPQWNADSTQVKINGRVELRFLLQAVRQAEIKIQNANTPMSKDTTKITPTIPTPPAVNK